MNIRQLGLFAVLLLVVIGSGWFLNNQGASQLPANVSATGPDSFIKHSDLAVMDNAGRLKYRVIAEYTAHFPNQDLLKLQRPDIKIVQADGTVWQISSEHGETSSAGDRAWLLGEVTIQRPATGTGSAIHVLTRDLLVKPQEETAETDKAATITADSYVIKSIGLKADFRSRILELHSRVKTTIEGSGDGTG